MLRRSFVSLTLLVIVLISTACGGGAAPAPVAQVPAASTIQLPLPDNFLALSQAARNNGNYLFVHGTVASVFETGPALSAAGYPVEVQNLVGNELLSFAQLNARCVTFICFNRHSIDPKVYGITDINGKANGLWGAISQLEGEPQPGLAFTTASAYSKGGIQLRLWDLDIANAKLLQAQTRLAAISLETSAEAVAERATLQQYVNFESQRISFYTALKNNDPTVFSLWEKMRRISVVVVSEVESGEITRGNNFTYQNGAGTRLSSGSLPFNRIQMLYIDAADATDDVLAVFRAKNIPYTITGSSTQVGAIQQSFNLWQSMPDKMYALAFKGAQAFETLSVYATVASVYVFAFTPAGIKAWDYFEVAASYQVMLDQKLGNFTEEEFYTLNQSWMESLAEIRDPITLISLYKPLLDFYESTGVVQSPAYRGGWSNSKSLVVGETAPVTIESKDGTAEHHVLADGTIIEAPAIAMELLTNPITYLGWTDAGPLVQWEVGQGFTSSAQVVLGSDQVGSWYLYLGCTQYRDTNQWISAFADVRYSSNADHSAISIYTRPQLFVGQNCITNVVLQ